MFDIRMPDITLAQIVAALGWIVAQAVSLGFIDDELAKVVLSTAVTVVSAAWVIGDAWIRHGRSKIVAAAIASPVDTKTELARVRG